MLLLTTAHCDTGGWIRQADYAWVLTDQQQPEQSEFFSSFTEYERQIEIPFESSVDESAVFQSLADQWRLQRGATSSISEMVLSPPYQSIIGMGPSAVRFILAALRAEGDEPDHWFWALQVITGTNPVAEECEGNLQEMAKAWLAWGISKGYAV